MGDNADAEVSALYVRSSEQGEQAFGSTTRTSGIEIEWGNAAAAAAQAKERNPLALPTVAEQTGFGAAVGVGGDQMGFRNGTGAVTAATKARATKTGKVACGCASAAF